MVTFKNGTQLETVAVIGSIMMFQNANRETLELRIAEENAEFDELKAIYTDRDALSEIEVQDGEAKSLQLNYTIPVELALKQIDGASVWCMKLAQKSELELAQARQAEDINDTQLAIIELASLIGGENNG